MTAIGFHYFPDEMHYRDADLHAWLPELQALGARWLTLVGSLTRAVPEPFIRGLVNAGIEPVIHIPAAPIRQVDLHNLHPLLESYEHWGVKHVVIFAEPNARAMWAANEWGKPALVERFLEMLIPGLLAQAEAGLLPTFPPLKAGGDYWDTAFLEAALAGMARRGLTDLMKQLSFAVNLWTFNRPPDWGGGGLKKWPDARPYRTPPGSQDQRGFRLFDWLDEIIQARVGAVRPLVCLAGGPRLGDFTDPAFPALDQARHASCTREIAWAVAENALPGNLLNVSFWLIAAGEGSPFAREAWYRSDGSTLAAVETLKQFAAATRAKRPDSKQPQDAQPTLSAPVSGAAPGDENVITRRAPPNPGGRSHRPSAAGMASSSSRASKDAGSAPKSIRHYLLLPMFEWGVSEWHWNAALKYVQAFHPTCGFSPDEARQAERVTILGNEQGVSREVEAALRQAGCQVERIRVRGRK